MIVIETVVIVIATLIVDVDLRARSRLDVHVIDDPTQLREVVIRRLRSPKVTQA